jgi:hypothetical protein
MTRDKRDCMRLGTGLCPRNEIWKDSDAPCNDCRHFITKEGKRDEQA